MQMSYQAGAAVVPLLTELTLRCLSFTFLIPSRLVLEPSSPAAVNEIQMQIKEYFFFSFHMS